MSKPDDTNMLTTALDLDPSGDRRDAIIAAALDVFMRYGFARVTMDDIARAAGLSRPLLYREFRNKADIYAAIAEKVLANALDAARKALCGAGEIDERLSEALRLGIFGPMSAISKSPHGEEILDVKTEIITDIHAQWRADFCAAIAAAIEKDAKDRGIDLAAGGFSAAGLAETVLDGIEGVKQRSTDPADWQLGADRLVALVMLALR